MCLYYRWNLYGQLNLTTSTFDQVTREMGLKP